MTQDSSTNRVLFITEVGSAAWKMNHPLSDSDRFVCYLMPTKDILRGRMKLVPNVEYTDPDHYTASEPDINDVVLDGNSHFSAGSGVGPEKIDRSSHELGKVVNEVVKNNSNFLFGIYSPIVLNPIQDPSDYMEHGPSDETEWFSTFKYLAAQCMSKVVYNPINGMAVHNKIKYYDSGKDKGWRREKTARTIVRTCNFGIAVLEGRGFVFDSVPPLGDKESVEVENALVRLKAARDASALPARPTKEAEDDLREFLYKTRLANLEEDG